MSVHGLGSTVAIGHVSVERAPSGSRARPERRRRATGRAALSATREVARGIEADRHAAGAVPRERGTGDRGTPSLPVPSQRPRGGATIRRSRCWRARGGSAPALREVRAFGRRRSANRHEVESVHRRHRHRRRERASAAHAPSTTRSPATRGSPARPPFRSSHRCATRSRLGRLAKGSGSGMCRGCPEAASVQAPRARRTQSFNGDSSSPRGHRAPAPVVTTLRSASPS